MNHAPYPFLGSTGFTIVALIGCARATPQGYGYFAAHPTAHEVLLIVANWAGIFMWVFTLWLFGVALAINLPGIFGRDDAGKLTFPMEFKCTWWAIIFPNVGFTIATIFVGQELESEAILWVSVAMTILLVTFWLLDLVLMGKAIWASFSRDPRIKLS